MIKTVLILGLAAIASAQVLRISPVVLGSSSPGQQQVIQLARGGGLGSGPQQQYRAQPQPQYNAPRVAAIQVVPAQAAPVQVAYAQPVQAAYAQPIQFQQARPVALVQPAAANYQSVPVASPSAGRYNAAQEEQQAPQPFSFAFDSEDEFGTKLGRQESGDQSGVVTGSYTLSDANGIARIVNYVADANGFRATVQTNEPGTLTSNPADVQIQSSAAPSRR